MTDRLNAGELPPKSGNPRDVEPTSPVADAKLPPGSEPSVTDPGEPARANQLTDEEQMALFEKELKETDWGHQPC